jgi:DNA-binding beta-propeller fold protein YncE
MWQVGISLDRNAIRLACLIALALGGIISASAGQPQPLVLEAKISLGDVRGRIDHLAIDVARQRLFVAELGNGSVGIVDLRRGLLLQTITAFGEPQGIGYEEATDTLYVADGGDGTVRFLHGADLAPAGQFTLGDDADNLRTDGPRHRVLVGYGSGALAVITAGSRHDITRIPLQAHPEAFQLDHAGRMAYINVPDAHEIAVVDLTLGRQVASWLPVGLSANFPMALDEGRGRALVAFRDPATLGVFDVRNGSLVSSVAVCGDADDVFVDSRRNRVYVSCGEGFIDVLAAEGGTYVRAARLATEVGARTALYVPEIDRLLLAVRATATTPAAVWVFRPAP